MRLNSIRQATVRTAALGLCGIALASAPAARAQDKMTAQSLIDRQLILDQITRYYYNFGRVDRQSEWRLHLAQPLRLERRLLSPQRPRARGPLSTWRSRIR
jgi:hypothetical protein